MFPKSFEYEGEVFQLELGENELRVRLPILYPLWEEATLSLQR